MPLPLTALLLPVALATPADHAGDEVLAALANDRPAEAVRALRERLAIAEDPTERADLLCLLGTSLARSGDPTGAIDVWESVPEDAACRPGAVFRAADARAVTQDAAAAVQLYAPLAAERLTEGRDDRTYRQIARLIDATATQTDNPADHRIGQLHLLALQLSLSSRHRHAAAMAAGHWALTFPDSAPSELRSQAADVLRDLLIDDTFQSSADPKTRALTARLTGGPEGLALLGYPPAPSPLVLAAQADILSEMDGLAGTYALERAVQAAPEDQDLQARLARDAEQQGRLEVSQRTWSALIDSPHAEEALRSLSRIAPHAIDDPTEALGARSAWLDRWLERFPTHARRPEIEAAWARTQRDLARTHVANGVPAEAVAVYDALLQRLPDADPSGVLAWEAAEATRLAGNATEARARMERLVATGVAPQRAIASLVDLRAEKDPTAAMGWLALLARTEGPAQYPASVELARREKRSIVLKSGALEGSDAPAVQGARPRVTATLRNIDAVTVRLHRIDAEAFFRSGGNAAALANLDVGVIAPDDEWTVDLPGGQPGMERTIDLPLRLPDVGVYAVTVDARTHQAQVVVRHGEGRVLARSTAGQLAVGVLHNGQPDPRARVLVRDGSRVLEARADARGIATFEVQNAGQASVLAMGRGGPSMTQLSVTARPEPGDTAWSVELDRPFVLPGEPVSLRMHGRRDGKAAAGTFRARLSIDGVPGPSRRFELSGWGTASFQLPVPHLLDGSQARSVEVQVLPLDTDTPTTLRTLPLVRPSGPFDRHLAVSRTPDGGLRVVATDAEGAIAADQTVELQNPLGVTSFATTDAAGQLERPPSLYGAEGTWWVRVPGAPWQTSRPPVPAAPLRLEPSIDAAGRAHLTISGPPGSVDLEWSRGAVDHPVPEALHSPLHRPVPELNGPESWEDAGAPSRRRSRQGSADEVGRRTVAVPADGSIVVDLPALPPGDWVVRAVHSNVRTAAVTRTLETDDGPRLVSAARPTPGTPVSLRSSQPALVTIETPSGLHAEWSGIPRVLPDQAAVRTAWVDATGAHGETTHAVDTQLQVQMNAKAHGDRWKVTLQVTDASGAEVPAEVSVRAIDQRIVDSTAALSIPSYWPPTSPGPRGLHPGSGGWGGPLADRRLELPIAGALLAEAARQEAAERAQRAASGRLEGGASEVLMGDLALESTGIGGLGTQGYGSGAGGSGYGHGRRSRMGTGSTSRQRAHLGPGHTTPGVWTTRNTDARGVLELDLPAPPPGSWVLQAHAIGTHAHGTVALPLASTATPRLVVPASAPALPGESLDLQVQVLNPTDQRWSGRVAGQPVDVGPHQTQTLQLEPLTAGTTRELVLEDASGHAVDLARASLPLAAPVVAASDGHLVRVSLDAGGARPLQLWLDEELAVPAPHAGTIARAGRLALAMVPHRDPSVAPQLRSLAFLQLQHLRLAPVPSTAEDAASKVAFLAEVAPLTQASQERDRVVVAVSATEVDTAIRELDRLVQSSSDRVAAQWARVVAGRPTDATTLARLQRDADRLPPETRARLADLLRRSGDAQGARDLLEGNGPIANSVRAALQLPQETDLPGPPPAGHPSRVFGVMPWLQAPAEKPRNNVARVIVDGTERGALSVSSGGSLTLAVGPTARVEVIGAPAAVIERGRGPQRGTIARSAVQPAIPGIRRSSPAPRVEATAACGSETNPCSLIVGDTLVVPGLRALPGAHCGPGLDCGAGSVVGRHPGRTVLTGFSTIDGRGQRAPGTIWVDVLPESSTRPGLSRDAALGFATLHHSVGLDPLPWLAPWPHFDDWSDAERAEAMRLRWAHRRPDAPAEVVAAFENLRDADPSAPLSLDEVRTVALAYAGADRPTRALEVWRAGLGAAFLAEAAPIRRLEPILGPLASLQILVKLPQAYPDLELVRRAQFHLPEKLAAIADHPLPPDLVAQGVTPTDIQLLAAAWDRRFLAFHPDDPLAAEASFHLAKGLLDLGAHAAAATQAQSAAARFPSSPLLDALVATDALARTALGDTRGARAHYSRLALATDWPQEDGTRGPASMAADARLALARLDEADGDYAAARKAYAAVAGQSTDAAHARQALDRVSITLPRIVVLGPREPAALVATAANVEAVEIRAYRLDLRTAFLRDGGLQGVHGLQVDGVSPEWSGTRQLDVGPFTRSQSIKLPLRGSGAWLVQADVDGARATSLVVRSSLSVDVLDGPAGRRVAVRRAGRPAPQIEVRALTAGGAMADRTDVRGVSYVPAGAPVLVFDGAEVAFSPPEAVAQPRRPAAPRQPSEDSLDKRARRQRQKNAVQFDDIYRPEEAESLDASMF